MKKEREQWYVGERVIKSRGRKGKRGSLLSLQDPLGEEVVRQSSGRRRKGTPTGQGRKRMDILHRLHPIIETC
jgi:hypothetical protein